jgi:Ca2+-binding EF-hand superfamily protein
VDGSGFIDMHEMRRMMVNLGEDMTIEEVDEILDSFDEDGDGQISPQEFADAVMAEQQSGTQALVKDKEKTPSKTPPPTPLPK